MSRLLLALIVAASSCACAGGSSPVGPSAVVVPDVSSAPRIWSTPSPFESLLYRHVGPVPVHWEGPMVHCLSPWIARGPVEDAVAEIQSVTGIVQRFAEPGDSSCSVGWTVNGALTQKGHAAEAGVGWGDDNVIRRATIFWATERGAAIRPLILHEMGHLLGLDDTQDPLSLMGLRREGDFSFEELSALRWIYQR